MSTKIVVDVHGRPAPQGSKRAFVRNGRAIIVDDSANTRPWRTAVHTALVDALPADWQPLRGPIDVQIEFRMPRPKAHYRANGELKPTAPGWAATVPDIDKLLRSTIDAIVTAGVIADDRLIVSIDSLKTYAPGSPGARITVIDLD